MIDTKWKEELERKDREGELEVIDTFNLNHNTYFSLIISKNKNIINISNLESNTFTHLEFHNCIFEKDLSILDTTLTSIKFVNCVFKEDAFLEGFFREVKFINCSYKHLSFLSQNKLCNLNFVNCNLNWNVFLYGYFNRVNIENSRINSDYFRFHAQISNLYLKHNIFTETLIFILGIKTVYLIKNTFNSATISAGKDEKDSLKSLIIKNNYGYLTINNSKLDILLEGAKNEDIYFKNMTLNTFYFKNFTHNNSNIYFDNCKGVEKLSFNNSSMGNTNFMGLDIKSFKKTTVRDSNILNIIAQDLPTENKILEGAKDIENTTAKHKQLNNTFKQFKTIATNNGDGVSAAEYQRLEYQYLNDVSFFDKILLLLNQWSNKHGYSWVQGVAFTFIISLLFFLLLDRNVSIFIPVLLSLIPILLFSLAFSWFARIIESLIFFMAIILFIILPIFLTLNLEDHYNLNSSIKDLIKPFSIKNYFVFLNPTTLSLERYTELTTGNKNISASDLSTKAYLIFFIGKIAIGYGIYQTIAAFRKYGKFK